MNKLCGHVFNFAISSLLILAIGSGSHATSTIADKKLTCHDLKQALEHLKLALKNKGVCAGRFKADEASSVLFAIDRAEKRSPDGYFLLKVDSRFGWTFPIDIVGKCATEKSCKGGEFLLSENTKITINLDDLDNIFGKRIGFCQTMAGKPKNVCKSPANPAVFYSISSGHNAGCHSLIVGRYQSEGVQSVSVMLGVSNG